MLLTECMLLLQSLRGLLPCRSPPGIPAGWDRPSLRNLDAPSSLRRSVLLRILVQMAVGGQWRERRGRL
jgi:hypothetical protein